MMERLKIFSAFLLIIVKIECKQYHFPGGVFESIDDLLVDPKDALLVKDPFNTGIPLFPAKTAKDEGQRLSLNFQVKDFKYSGSEADYFRASPALFSCIQEVYNYIYNTQNNKRVVIVDGYKISTDLQPSSNKFWYEQYLQTGGAVSLGINGGTTEVDVEQIAKAVLTYCPYIFGVEMKDIGLVATSDRLFLYMAPPNVKEPSFKVDGYSALDNNGFNNWALQRIDDSYDPKKLPDCAAFPELETGMSYPENRTEEQAVGSLDEPVVRGSEDFNRLVQYMGRNIEFEDTESSSSWCGTEDYVCAACKDRFLGNHVESRCADRLMTPRLYTVVSMLQALTREEMSGAKLKILDAYDEPYEGKPGGDHSAGSIHFEGRAATIQLTSGTNMKKLAQLAVCSGADFVKNNGDHLTIAVRKQDGLSPRYTSFPSAELLAVLPPSSRDEEYDLTGQIMDMELPLHDSSGRETQNLSTHLKINQITGLHRYFRFHPALTSCYDELVKHEQRWLPVLNPGGPINLEVVDAFLTSADVLERFDPNYDSRQWNHVKGLAMEVKYAEEMSQGKFDTTEENAYTANRLAHSILHNCAQVFEKAGYAMGLGIYDHGVYVDLRDNFHAWYSDPSLLPAGVNKQQLKMKYLWSVDGRVFNPENPALVRIAGTPPLPQSPDYVYEHSHYVKERRRKRQAGTEEEDCIPQGPDSDFCKQSKSFRKNEADHLWSQIELKHLYVKKETLRNDLNQCLGEEACGTCLKGRYWEAKIEHCNNLLHRMPFELHNEVHGVSNLFCRENRENGMNNYACHGARHCVEKSPLFAIMGNSVEALYRPDPKRSIEHELYGREDNPLPVFEIIQEIYCMHANGTVSVWVDDENDMKCLRRPLRPCMVFNKNVKKIDVYVRNAEKKADVGNALNSMITDWIKNTDPRIARDAVAHYAIKDITDGIAKRDIHVDRDFSEELLQKRRDFERHWVTKTVS